MCWCEHNYYEHNQQLPSPPLVPNPPPRGGITGRCTAYLPVSFSKFSLKHFSSPTYQQPQPTYLITSLCAHPGCGQPWTMHERSIKFVLKFVFRDVNSEFRNSSNNPTTLVPLCLPSQPIVERWSGPSNPPMGSTNDRRLQHGAATTPAFSASRGQRSNVPRGPTSRPFPGTGQSFRTAGFHHRTIQGPQTEEFQVLVFPYGVSFMNHVIIFNI